MSGVEVLVDFWKSAASFLNSAPGVGAGRWAFAVMFLFSGSMKLKRPLLAAFAIVDFGLTKRARPVHGLTLGLIEVGLAIWLASGLGVTIGLMAAAALLLSFTVLIAWALRRGGGFPCFCFGESDSSVSPKTLWRTGALTLCAFALVPPSSSFALTASASAPEFVVGTGLVGVLVLVSRVPALFGWDPLRLKTS